MTVRGVLPCFVDGCDRAGVFGFGLPGLRKDLPEGKRGYLWACTDPDHRAAAEDRRARAIKKESGSEGADDTASEPDHRAQPKENSAMVQTTMPDKGDDGQGVLL